MNDVLVDKIAQICVDHFNSLPKTGKPMDVEWTAISCIVRFESDVEKCEIVSLGSGTKCIGATQMSEAGDVLNDSHAEVIARRGFLVYLYQELENALKNQPSIFSFDISNFILKPGIEFIFFSSHLPCGDASIIRRHVEDDYGIIKSNKRSANIDICDVERKTLKSDEDNVIHRTGAKCLNTAEQERVNYQTVGQVRIKPGRGDRTLSVSCSDKLARWIHIGIQGALLDMLLAEPIYMKCFIFGADVPYSYATLERTLLKRKGNDVNIKLVPSFHQSRIAFPYFSYKKNKDRVRASPHSIVWIKTDDKKNNGKIEAASAGMKLGLTKKSLDLLSNKGRAYLCISKYKLYQKFLNLLVMEPALKSIICGQTALETIPYNEMKNKAERYNKNWKDIRESFFKIWTNKPDIWNFCVNIENTLNENTNTTSITNLP